MQKKIVFANLDTQFLTMYSESGEEIVIAQGDPRIRKIVESVFPAIAEDGFYMLGEEDLLNANHYAEAEKNLGGMVKFFRMAKAKLAEIVDRITVDLTPKSAGKKPALPVTADRDLATTKPFVKQVDNPTTMVQAPPADMVVQSEPIGEAEPVPEPKGNTALNSALAEIMDNAVSVGSLEYIAKGDMQDDETIVAVVDGKQVVSGVEKIQHQLMSIAQKLGSAEGVTNFFRRVATVERGHSVEDLLTFMEKGELPIADDGTVLVYKLLNEHGQGDSLYFTDVHSGNVKQKVGSKVFMAEELVDANRNKDCSNGLHIARRDYLRSFSGNACMLCKLAPEDVIAVPHSDARKLRAKGYFIVAQLSKEDRDRVKNNQPMKDSVLLGNVARGNHTEVLETVEITKQQGGGLKITSLQKPKKIIELDQNVKSSSLDELQGEAAVTVDARSIALGELNKPKATEPKPVAPVVGKGKPVTPIVQRQKISRIAQLQKDLAEAKKGSRTEYYAALALLKYKKDSKKTWTALGVPALVFDTAQKIADKGEPAQQPVVKALAPKKPAKAKAVTTTKTSTAKVKPIVDKSKAKLTQGDRARELYSAFKQSNTKANAQALLDFKKTAKKSWEVLGLSDQIGADVVKAAK